MDRVRDRVRARVRDRVRARVGDRVRAAALTGPEAALATLGLGAVAKRAIAHAPAVVHGAVANAAARLQAVVVGPGQG